MPRRQLFLRLTLGGASAATGAALLAYFLTGLPLLAALCATVALAAGVWIILWRRLVPGARDMIAHRARIGLLAGLAATLGYDLTRKVLVDVTRSTVRPFEACDSLASCSAPVPRGPRRRCLRASPTTWPTVWALPSHSPSLRANAASPPASPGRWCSRR